MADNRVATSDENTHLDLFGAYVIYQFVFCIILCVSLMGTIASYAITNTRVLRAMDKAHMMALHVELCGWPTMRVVEAKRSVVERAVTPPNLTSSASAAGSRQRRITR